MAEDPFAAMLALGEAMVVDNVETGTSVRAKRGLNPLLAARLKDPTACEAKVVAVNRAGFPQSHSSSLLSDRQRKVLVQRSNRKILSWSFRS